ncbi:MAG: class I SAM-dependent methyltransferase [Acidimicrobiales bacterium]
MSDHASEITDDGSPVAAYLAMPFGESPDLIHRAVGSGGTILELGCGAGRITRPLVGLGHPVVAVDDSPAMLEHVTGADKVCADLFELRLGRRFEGVVGGSHLIDSADRDRRLALLAVCRRHVVTGGVVLLERYEPEWVRSPADSDGRHGLVGIEFRVLEHRGTTFDATITYRLGDRHWTQRFTAAAVDEDEIRRDAADSGLAFDRWLDDRRTWALLTPV